MPYIPGAAAYRGSRQLSAWEEARRKEEEESLLGPAIDIGISGLGGLGAIADTPRSMIANVVDMVTDIGRGELPDRLPLTGLFTPEDRIYGEDLYKSFGFDSSPGGWGGEIALEIAMDPLTYMSFGLSAVAKTNRLTKALTKSGVLSKAGDIATVGRSKADDILQRARKLIGDDWVDKGGTLSSFTMDMADPKVMADAVRGVGAKHAFMPLEMEYLDDWLEMGVNLEKQSAKTGFGHRQLRRMLTPSDVVNMDPTGNSKDRLWAYLGRKDIAKKTPGGWKYTKGFTDEMLPLWNQPLGKQAHIAGIGGVHSTRLAKWMDRAGEFGRFNPVSRELVQMFGAGVRGTRSRAAQQWAPKIAAHQEAARAKTQQVIQQLSTEKKLYQSGIDYSGHVDEDVMRQWFEVATDDPSRTKLLEQYRRNKKALSRADVDLLEKQRKMVSSATEQLFDDMRDVGMDVTFLRDNFAAYFPRRMVHQAFKFNGSDVDVDLMKEFLEEASGQLPRSAARKNVLGSTVRLKTIYKDKQLNDLLDEARRLSDEAMSAPSGTPPKKSVAQAWFDFESYFWREYGSKYFRDQDFVGKNVGKINPAWTGSRRMVQGVPEHAKAFLDDFKNLSREQREAGLYAHDVVRDLGYAMEAGADAVVSRRAQLDLIAKYAVPRTSVLDDAGDLIRPHTAGHGSHLPDSYPTLRQIMSGDPTNPADKGLAFRTELFDKSGDLIQLNYKSGTQDVAQKHLVELRDDIFKRLAPGKLGENVSRTLRNGGDASHLRGALFDNQAQLDDLLDNFVIPDEIAADLVRLKKVYEKPDRSMVKQLWDGYLTLMKGHLTTPFMAFAGRNWLSGQVRNMVVGLFSRESVRMSHQLMLGKVVKGAKEIPGMADELASRGMKHTDDAATTLLQEKVMRHDLMPEKSYGVDPVGATARQNVRVEIRPGLQPIEKDIGFVPMNSPFSLETAKMWAGWDEAGRARAKVRGKKYKWFDPRRYSDFLEVEGGFSASQGRKLETHFSPIRAGQELNQWVEGSNRISPFLKALMDGTDELAAANRVMGAQVDYASRKFTRFERGFMQRIFPFYKFRAGQVKWLPEELAERPGGPIPKIIRSINTMRGRNEYMPEYLSESTAIRTDEMFGGNVPGLTPETPGAHRYLQGLNLMFEDPMGMLPTLRDPIGGPALAAISSMHPAFKFGVESAFQKSSFQGGRDLSDASSPLQETLANLMGVKYGDRAELGPDFGRPPALLDHMLQNSPLARYMTTIKQATSPIPGAVEGEYGDALSALAQLTIGVKPKTVYPETRAALKQQRVLERMKEFPEADTFEKTAFSRKDILRVAERDPEKARKMRLLQKAMDQLAREAKERRVKKMGGREAVRIQRREEAARMEEFERLMLMMQPLQR